MDSLDVNDTCKRSITLVNKCIYTWFVQAICFVTPKLYFATSNGVTTHSLRSPDLDNISLERNVFT